MSKKSFRWQDSDVVLFLEYYKQLSCLWNTKHPDYKNQFRRKTAYDTLRNNMEIEGLSISDVKNKIKGLRTTYSDELNKIIQSRSNGGEVYEPKLFWFKLADTFLRTVTDRREKKPLNLLRDTIPGNLTNQDQEETHPEQAQLQMDDSDSQDPNRWEIKAHRGRKRRKSNSFKKNYTVDNKVAIEEDEFDLFGRSIAMQLKKLPELEGLQLMHNMQSMILNKKLELRNKSRSSYIYMNEDEKDPNTETVDKGPSTSDPLNYTFGDSITSTVNEALKFETEEDVT